jgi:hypothetical protein
MSPKTIKDLQHGHKTGLVGTTNEVLNQLAITFHHKQFDKAHVPKSRNVN